MKESALSESDIKILEQIYIAQGSKLNVSPEQFVEGINYRIEQEIYKTAREALAKQTVEELKKHHSYDLEVGIDFMIKITFTCYIQKETCNVLIHNGFKQEENYCSPKFEGLTNEQYELAKLDVMDSFVEFASNYFMNQENKLVPVNRDANLMVPLTERINLTFQNN